MSWYTNDMSLGHLNVFLPKGEPEHIESKGKNT